MTTRASEPWWKTAAIYHVYLLSFQDSDRDGHGDLAGVTERLPYLQWLGVDALWLPPIYRSPMEDFGYDVSDYRAIDPLYGDLQGFDALVAEAHRRGLRVILDFVPNHTSHRHPWFFESSASRTSAKRSWYIWADARPDGGPPNNWRSINAPELPGSAWHWHEATRQYYYSSFSAQQPDLNWREHAVSAAVCDALRFWLDRGIDGFRLDLVDFLGKDPEFRDEPDFIYRGPEADYFSESLRQLDQGESLRHLDAIRAAMDDYPDAVVIGETCFFLGEEKLCRFHGPKALDLALAYRLAFLPFEAAP